MTEAALGVGTVPAAAPAVLIQGEISGRNVMRVSKCEVAFSLSHAV
jgi:hypothetical protein